MNEWNKNENRPTADNNRASHIANCENSSDVYALQHIDKWLNCGNYHRKSKVLVVNAKKNNEVTVQYT